MLQAGFRFLGLLPVWVFTAGVPKASPSLARSSQVRREARSQRSAARHADLSAQEYKVLLALAAGRRTGEVAAELNVSAKTVSTYKRRVLNKLGLKSTTDLVRYVIDHKLS